MFIGSTLTTYPPCPKCGHPAGLVIGDRQAFCNNDDCKLLMWDPSRTYTAEELAAAPEVTIIKIEKVQP